MSSVVSGVKWTSVSTMGRRVLALLANVAFARLLAPSDFGLVAMAGVLLGFIDIFKDLGTGTALIRDKDLSEERLSSVFWLNTAFGLGMTLAIVALSPLAAVFYHEPRVQGVLMAMAPSFFLSALGIVQSSLLTRQMAFVKLAKIELAAALLSYMVGMVAAVLGQGVWSLVYQVLTNTLLGVVFMWGASGWRPKMLFRWLEVKPIMSYSLNLTGYNVFYYFAQNVDNLLIGRFLGTEALGLYDLAYKLMSFPMQAISSVFARVMTPYYAQAQDDLPRFRQAFLQVGSAIAFVTFPLMIGLLAVRGHFVLTVFGPNWMPVATLLAMFAPLGAIRSVLTTTGSIYIAKGRTDLQLRWGVLSNLIVFAGLAIGLHWGAVGVAAGFTVTALLLLYPNFAIPMRLIDLPFRQMMAALIPSAVCALLMFATIVGADMLFQDRMSPPTALMVLVALGMASYTLYSWLFNREMLLSILSKVGIRTPAMASL
ncbi:MOP flippase family protein [Massilia aerilata]|uniref:MOP flippase family protein n=1 Tax=Massilia aerilata TaxID=453817 RepID=A0ABW0S7Q2_9BURK